MKVFLNFAIPWGWEWVFVGLWLLPMIALIVELIVRRRRNKKKEK